MTHSSRRTFLKATGAVGAAALRANPLAATTLSLPIGLQLYSVREILPKDFDGTLGKVAGDGYKVVEAAGYFGHSAEEWRAGMERAGLRCISTHFPLGTLNPQLDQQIEYGKKIGLEYIICSSPIRRDPAA